MRTESAPASFMHSERVLLRSKLPTLIERATVGNASAGQDTSSTDSAGAASAAPPAHDGQAAVSRGPPAKRAKRSKGRKGTKRERLLRSKVQLVEEAQYGAAESGGTSRRARRRLRGDVRAVCIGFNGLLARAPSCRPFGKPRSAPTGTWLSTPRRGRESSAGMRLGCRLGFSIRRGRDSSEGCNALGAMHVHSPRSPLEPSVACHNPMLCVCGPHCARVPRVGAAATEAWRIAMQEWCNRGVACRHGAWPPVVGAAESRSGQGRQDEG